MARSQRPPASAAVSRSAGFSLTEVMIGILLTAIIVSSVFSVSLTTRRQIGLSDDKVQAGYFEHKLMEELKNYVTASLEPGAGPGPTAGPGADPTWSLVNDTCQPCSGNNCGCAGQNAAGSAGCYALAPGAHDVTAMLPANIVADPSLANPKGLSMKMCYVVTDESGSSPFDQGLFRPQVQVFVQWTKPAT